MERVVALSTCGARPGGRIGDLGTLHRLESLLHELDSPVAVVRAGYLYSNWDGAVEAARAPEVRSRSCSSFAGNELVAVYRIRVGRQIGSAALVADGVHARTDGFTSLAVVVGVVGVWLGFPLADPLVGLLISIAIFVLLFGTARDIGRRLLDGVDPTLTERAERAIAAVPGVTHVDDTRVRWVGHRLHVEATVASDPNLPVGEFHQLEHLADTAVRKALPSIDVVRLNPSAHPDTAPGPAAPATA